MSEELQEILRRMKDFAYYGWLTKKETSILNNYIEQLQQENKELKRRLNWIVFGEDSELALRYLRKIGYVDFDDERKCYINKHNNEPFFLNETEEKSYYLKDEELDEYTQQLEQKNKELKEQNESLKKYYEYDNKSWKNLAIKQAHDLEIKNNILTEFEKWLEEEMGKEEDCWYGSTLILADDKRQVLIEVLDKLQELKEGKK